LVHLNTKIQELVLHHLRGRQRDDYSGRALQSDSRRGTGKSSVATRGAVKVNVTVTVGNSTGHEIADTTGLEGATGLKIVQLEVNVARALLVSGSQHSSPESFCHMPILTILPRG
jgi:hypothetical protein